MTLIFHIIILFINYLSLGSKPFSVSTLQMRIVIVSRGMSWIQGLANEGMQEQCHPDFSAIETLKRLRDLGQDKLVTLIGADTNCVLSLASDKLNS